LAEVAVHGRVEEADPLHVGQPYAPQAVGGPDVEDLRLHGAVLARLFLLLDADDGAGQRAGRAEPDLDPLAAGLVEDLAVGGVAVEVDGVAPEGLVDGVVAVVADHADPAAVEVL